jgi:hypothetical protein
MVSKAPQGETHIHRVNITPYRGMLRQRQSLGYYNENGQRDILGWVCYCVCVKEELVSHVNTTGTIESVLKPRTPLKE